MKFEILKCLLIEETRLHSELRGRKNFLFFPLVLFIGTVIVVFSMSKYSILVFSEGMILATIIMFFVFGILSGGFGLHATDYLERRFGDYGKLFSNMLALPIKLSDVFLMTAISDSIFYLGWFIVPIMGGSAVGAIFAGSAIYYMPLLFLSVLCAFVIGIGVSFFLSVLITKSKIGFFIALLFVGFSIKSTIFIPFLLYMNFNLTNILLNLLLIFILFTVTGLMIGNEYNTIKRKKRLHSLRFKNHNHFLFKDFIDLYRTHGLFVKPLFNVLGPSIIMLVLLSSITMFQGELGFMTHNLIFAAVLLGVMTVNFFNVLLSGDSMSYYLFLPVYLRDFIKPKIILAEVICVLQGVILLIIYSYFNSLYTNLFYSIIILTCFVYYTICINFFINGLRPNDNSMNLVSLGWMLILFLPIILIGLMLPLFVTHFLFYLGFSILLIGLGYLFYNLGIHKWENHI